MVPDRRAARHWPFTLRPLDAKVPGRTRGFCIGLLRAGTCATGHYGSGPFLTRTEHIRRNAKPPVAVSSRPSPSGGVIYNATTMLRCIALTLLAAAAAFPQTASLTGRITDSTGAVVPGARVTVKAVASGIETSVDANDQGFYNLTLLPPGAYTVAVTKPGFQTLREPGLELGVQQVAGIDLTQ